jgi:hypothetical protein
MPETNRPLGRFVGGRSKSNARGEVILLGLLKHHRTGKSLESTQDGFGTYDEDVKFESIAGITSLPKKSMTSD